MIVFNAPPIIIHAGAGIRFPPHTEEFNTRDRLTKIADPKISIVLKFRRNMAEFYA